MELLEHEKRVVAEKDEVMSRLLALGRFSQTETFRNLPLAEQKRLRRQEYIMILYAQVLEERIDAFMGDGP